MTKINGTKAGLKIKTVSYTREGKVPSMLNWGPQRMSGREEGLVKKKQRKFKIREKSKVS